MKEKINSYLVSAGISLNVFWISNVFKTANPGVKEFLDFYKPVGPLLGLFILSTLAFVVSLVIFRYFALGSQKFAVRFYIVSVIIFLFMVFPPILEPIAELLSGK